MTTSSEAHRDLLLRNILEELREIKNEIRNLK